MPVSIRRREVIAALGGAVAAWPLAARAAECRVGVLSPRSPAVHAASHRDAPRRRARSTSKEIIHEGNPGRGR
jgi:hypothetical protein